jgi:hypothetical protein
MKISKGMWILLIPLLVLLSACQQQPTLATVAQDPATAATAKASQPGTINNPYVLRKVTKGARAVGANIDGVVFSTKTKVYVDAVVLPRIDPAALMQLASDLGIGLSQVANSLSFAKSQAEVIDYWLVPWSVLTEAPVRTGAISKPIPIAGAPVSLRISVSMTDCHEGTNRVTLMIDLFFRGKWYQAPDSDVWMTPTPCVERIDQNLMEQFRTVLHQVWGAFSDIVDAAIDDIIRNLPPE